MAEFDTLDDLGLINDKQFICSCWGFLTRNNGTRDICKRFIGDGGHFYDILARYDSLCSYVLNREYGRTGNIMKMIAPFLRAYGATDMQVHNTSAEYLELMPKAGYTMRYALDVIPTFITTGLYEHDVMNICEALDIPMGNLTCTDLSLDSQSMPREDARTLREEISKISSLRLPRMEYPLNVPMELDELDIRLLKVMDDVSDTLDSMDSASAIMRSMSSVGSNEKAYTLLEIRRRTSIELDGTVYIGSDTSDYQAMELVNESGGLALSFNGEDFAVRGSNIAVLSNDCTVAAVILQEFYNGGIESVLELAENWSMDYLKEKNLSNPYLVDSMLKENPRKLPEVYAIDKDNVDEIAGKSAAYRRKILGFRSNFS